MANFILIGFCIFIGFLFKKRKLVPADEHKSINAWIINVALPAVSLKYLTHITWTSELLLPALSPVIIFLAGLLFVRFAIRKLKPAKEDYGALQLAAGLSNTSFVGFPLIVAYFSEKELSIAIICDQVTFILFSVFGMVIAVQSSGKGKATLKQVLRKLVVFPPFLGCVIALLIPKSLDLSAIEPVFNMLAATVAPLALFSIGLQLSFEGWKQEIRPILTLLSYKLLIAPAIIFCIVLALGLNGMIAKISVFEAAMPILLSVGILADSYNLNVKLTTLMIGVSIVASFATTWIWWMILDAFL